MVAKAPPKSWAKEQHEKWAKIPPEAQEYIELREKQMLDGIEQYKEYHAVGKTISDVIAPYRPMLAASGTDPAKAVAVLLNANYRLTTGPAEARKQAFIELGASLGLIPQQNVAQEPPAVREMRERLAKLEGSLTQREQQQFEETRTRVASEVETFSKTAPYFRGSRRGHRRLHQFGERPEDGLRQGGMGKSCHSRQGERPAGEGNSRQTPGKSEG